MSGGDQNDEICSVLAAFSDTQYLTAVADAALKVQALLECQSGLVLWRVPSPRSRHRPRPSPCRQPFLRFCERLGKRIEGMSDVAAVENLVRKHQALRKEIAKVIVTIAIASAAARPITKLKFLFMSFSLRLERSL